MFNEGCALLTKDTRNLRSLAYTMTLLEQTEEANWRPLLNRRFGTFLVAEIVSLTGDQFYLVAMPWLVLRMTGSPMDVGAVVAMAALPRALFLLLAGTLTDRWPAGSLIVWSSLWRLALVSALAFLTGTGRIELWMLFPLALGFGVGDAFYFPARNALIPNLVKPEALLAGNAAAQATSEAATFLGPVLVGALIASLRSGSGTETTGIAIAFAVDALTFAIAAILVTLIRPPNEPRSEHNHSCTLWESTMQGIRFARSDPFLRWSLVLIGAGTFLLTGPLYVGLPVLASTRYVNGVADYGWILGLFGAGSLAGIATAALAGRTSDRRLPWTMAICPFVLGAGLGLLGLVHTAALAMLIGCVMGFAQGFLVVRFLTHLQTGIPRHILGRIMSLLMLFVVGLSPLSSGIAGVMLEYDVHWLMVGAGSALIIVVLASLIAHRIWPGSIAPREARAELIARQSTEASFTESIE